LSDRCERSLSNAARFVRWHGDGVILPAHALFGVVDEGTGVAADAMQRAGLDLVDLRVRLVLRLRVRRTLPRPVLPPVPSPVLLSLLERALVISQSRFNHRYVGTEHLYLAMLDAGVPVLVETLADVGQAPSTLKRQLFELLGVENAAA
jgi:ATP-dependent Clp protease ATP-binding subunit ClpC